MSDDGSKTSEQSSEKLLDAAGSALSLIADAIGVNGATSIGALASASSGLVGSGILYVAKKMADRRLTRILNDLDHELLALKSDKSTSRV